MEDYHYIPIRGKLRYLPVILPPAKRQKKNEDVLFYIPILPTNPDTDLDQEPIVPEDA